jgi:molybdopterin/thiamine biosynthesis adenylyltransferase
MSFIRYNRQELIKGWDQSKIQKSSVAIVGSDFLAGKVSILLTSLGVGALDIYDTEKINIYERNLFFECEDNEPRVEVMERMLKKINPYVDASGVNATPNRHFLTGIIGQPDIIMELTNNAESKKACLSYGKKLGIPVITASANNTSGKFYFTNDYDKKYLLLEEYSGKKQGIIPSEMLAGIIVENFRKYVAPITKEEKPIKSLGYTLNLKSRFFEPTEFSQELNDINPNPNLFSNTHATIVGAGALGNPVAAGLALLGVGRMDIIDGDYIEETNLNRQPFFYNAVGQMKAEILAKRVNKMNVEMNVKSINRFLDENFEPYFKKNKPDIIIDCVDNLSARAIINHYALEYGIPLVSGGTGPNSGQVMSYKPYRSACLNCRMQVDKEMVEERTRHSCIRDPMPSVITSNEVISGIMLGETVSILFPEIYGDSVNGMIKYDSSKPTWVGVIHSEEKCNCKRGDIKVWMEEVMKKYKSEK